MFKVIGFIIGFLVVTIAIYLFGFDFDQRGADMGFWFVMSSIFGWLGTTVGGNYDKRN